MTLRCGQTLGNRLAKAAMTEGLAEPHGRPTPQLNRLYERWGASGCGLLITGNVQVDPDHLERPGNVVIDREPDVDMAERLAAWAAAGKRGGAKMWMQISHAGRQTSKAVNPHPKAPSAVALNLPGGQFGEPVALDVGEIMELAERFVTAARAAEASGFDGVQIHAAHGYLISQFLSPRTNQRSDAWGGDLAGRARLLMEIVRRIRAGVAVDFAVSVKLNSADFQRGGFDIDDSTQVATWLDEAGVDLIEISGGTYESPRMMSVKGKRDDALTEAQRSTHRREAYFAEFAPRIREATDGAALMVTGGFRTAAGMSDAIERDGVDVIGLGRPLCVRPQAVGELLAGERAALPDIENQLRIGPGIFAPKSPLKVMKLLNTMSSQAWYYEQLVRFGDGENADESMGLLSALVKHRRREADKLADIRKAVPLDDTIVIRPMSR
jgi:2,4-dienoyl-CoA reductase-like NADH-dependent reductase (Old Yellow Enzyme family)